MEKTDTKQAYGDMELLHVEIDEAAEILCKGGVALLPTDTVWSTVVLLDPGNKGIGKLERYLDTATRHACPELLVRNNQEARQYLAELHPRLETLWTYHVRPLTILFENPVGLSEPLVQENGTIAIRVVTEDYLRGVIERCGMPLIALPATSTDGGLALNFEQVSGDLIGEMDYVSRYRRLETAEGTLSVMVRFSGSEELEFLRE